MDLKRRLARLEPKGLDRNNADSRIGSLASAASSFLPPSLDFREHDGPGGRVWIRERGINEADWPESLDLGLLNPLFTQRAPSDLHPDEILLLDTETTGLVGGTGTLAFLIGTVYQQKNTGLHLRQYFLPSPGAEPAMLADLSKLAGRFRLVMTYNGNSFDLPLLRTRGILSRIRNVLHDPISWDLLPAVRRLWGRRLANCRQQSVEESLRGGPRGAGDIDGNLIPQVWLDFVREGCTRGLREVVIHNDRDMLGMVSIFRALTDQMRVYRKNQRLRLGMPWQDAWSLALIAERQHDKPKQGQWISVALAARNAIDVDTGRPGNVERFWKDVLRLIKRTGTIPEIGEVLDQARVGLGNRPWLEREAAMYHEHRLGDPLGALIHANRLGDIHRINRLQQKLEVQDTGRNI